MWAPWSHKDEQIPSGLLKLQILKRYFVCKEIKKNLERPDPCGLFLPDLILKITILFEMNGLETMRLRLVPRFSS